MKRRIINIDEEKCNGCGACANACHEGAIGMVNGKAHLMREDFCDGLGDCLPACPTGAITFEEREAPAYNEAAVLASKKGVCPGTAARRIEHRPFSGCPGTRMAQFARSAAPVSESDESVSMLSQWPVQIKLAPVNAPWLDRAHLLIAADCTAYARADFHARFIQGRVTLIGCPKLDNIDYSEKLTDMLVNNDIRDVTIVRMQVPCCGGMASAVQRAIAASGKRIPLRTVIISTDGRIVKDETVG